MMHILFIAPVANAAVGAELLNHNFLLGFADGHDQKNIVLLGNIETVDSFGFA